MSINDKEYKRKCLQGIPASTLATSKCGCCCVVGTSLRDRVNRDEGMQDWGLVHILL